MPLSDTERRQLTQRSPAQLREATVLDPPLDDDGFLRVEIDNEASDFFTVIEVGAPDRLGLLFDITRTLAELQLDVHLAKVATFGGRVVDSFYVRDDLGRRVDDLERVRELEDALRGRLSP